MENTVITPIGEDDRAWVEQFLIEHWGGIEMISRGIVMYPHKHPGFIATHEGERVGLLTYRIVDGECEVTNLDSICPSIGVGGALIDAVKAAAQAAGCRRLWLITTNDNMNALRFYQKRGFALVAVHRNALEESRKLKPQIPLIGYDGIPLRDEIELEIVL
jgi:ribosomal protein S18 acetylase RimI-like enzyme